MTRNELAVDAATQELEAQGWNVSEEEGHLMACSPYDECYDFEAVMADTVEVLDILAVETPEDLNGASYLAVFAEDLDQVFYLPVDELPEGQFILALDDAKTYNYLEASRFVDIN